MEWLKVSKIFQVPQKTWRSLAADKYGTPEDAANCKHGRPSVFTPDLESELVRYCLAMEEKFYGNECTKRKSQNWKVPKDRNQDQRKN